MKSESKRPVPPYRQTALVLQGGGAIGAYQVGVYRALEEAGYRPDWFAGTSIGGINAAIMAGNRPEDRLEQLERFWERITRKNFMPVPNNGATRHVFNLWSAWQTMVFGQPRFFSPRAVLPMFAMPGSPQAVSYYTTDELRATLDELIDFELLNSDRTHRLSLGAVNVRTGKQVYFDSRETSIRIEHVLASGALPPAFGPVEVDGEWYWDGGIVSNTPLDVVIDDHPRVSTLCFMVDLFEAAGPLPKTIDEVEMRRKDIVYANRSDRNIGHHENLHNLRRAVTALWSRLPAETQRDPHLRELAGLGCTTTMQIAHIVYRGSPENASFKDYEFSAASISERSAAGYQDARKILETPAWQDTVPPDVGVVVYGDAERKQLSL